MDEQLQFIDGLRAWGLQAYVNDAIKDFIARFPEAVGQIRVAELKGLLAIGDFDKAKASIAAQADPNSVDTWAMKLALADGYYAWGKYGEAQGLYEAFFKQYPDTPPAALNDFFRDAAYRYAQMLMLMGKDQAAIAAYRVALKAQMERYVRRQLLSEMAELIIKTAEPLPPEKRAPLLEEARKIAGEILWVRDLWFGKAIVFLAHMDLMEGHPDQASKLVDDYKEDLQAIHDQLVEDSKQPGSEDLTRLSPMAECRYLLGSMMQSEAEKMLKAGGDKAKIVELLAGKETGRTMEDGSPERTSGALQHFLTVFVLYPTSQWAPEAGVRARRVEDVLRTQFGARINTSITDEQMARVRQSTFQSARASFNQQLFEKAVASYLDALALFPESETSVSAVGELCQCYLELGEEVHADCVASYLAERFSGSKAYMSAAGDQMIKLATYCGERKMPDRRDAFYDYYFAHFPNHPRVAGMLYMFGEERTESQDYDGALKYYRVIMQSHTNSPVYAGAASRTAFCYSKMGDSTNEIRVLQQLVDTLKRRERPGHLFINAQFRLAQAYMRLGDKYLPAAHNRFVELVSLIRKDGNAYANSAEEREANQQVLEGALFYSSISLSRVKPAEDKVVLYQQKAIDGLEDLVKTFPKSQFAPAALNQIGTLYVLLDKPEEARKAFDRLRKDYPDTDEARNSNYLLAKTLLELGRRDKAVTIFKEMFEGAGSYTSSQILTAGRELLKAGEAEISLQAFERVVKSDKDRAALEPATLGKGQALLALGRGAEAAETLKRMLNDYQNSGYTVPACLALSQAYAKLGATESDAEKRAQYFKDAVKAMNRARTFEKSPAGRAALDIGVARIYVNKAASERQFGAPASMAEARGMAVATYQTLITMADPRDAEVRKHIETAYGECLPLLAEMGNWEDVLHDADAYLELFPRGPYSNEARAQRTTARSRLMAAGTLPPEAGDAQGAPLTNATAPAATEPAPATTNDNAAAGAEVAPAQP
jgi:tetratricopeptide (TPR) repeat protein